MRLRILEAGPPLRRGILLVTVAGVPLVFLPSLNASFDLPKLAWMIAGVALVAGIRAVELLQGASFDGSRRLIVPAAAVAVPLTVAWALSPYRWWGLFATYERFDGLVPTVTVILMGVLVADSFDDKPERVAYALLIGSAGVAGYALIQLVGIDPFPSATGYRATSTVGNPDVTGPVAGMGVPLAMVLWWSEPARRNLAITALLVLAGGVYASQTDGGYAALVVGAALTGGFLLTTRWRFARAVGVALAGVVAVAVMGAVAFATINPDSPRVPAGVEERVDLWGSALRMATDAPALGHGPGAFGLLGVQYRGVEEAIKRPTTVGDDPHSVPLWFASSGGALGAIAFLVLVWWIVRRGMALDGGNPIGAGFLGVAGAYLVPSLFTINDLTLRLFLWVAIGGVAASIAHQDSASSTRGRKARSKPPARPKGRGHTLDSVRAPLGVAVIAVVVAAAVVWPLVALAADARYKDAALTAQQPVPPVIAIGAFDRALGLWDTAAYRAGAGYLIGLAAARSAAPDVLQEAQAYFAYLDRLPDFQGLFVRARVLRDWAVATEDRSDQDRAIDAYRDVLAVDPHNPVLRAEMSTLLVSIGDYERAYKILASIEPMVGELSAFWASVALARAHLGDFPDALEAIARTVAVNPNEPAVNDAVVPFIARAEELLDDSRYEDALSLIEPLFPEPAGGDPTASGIVAIARFHSGDIAGSIEALQNGAPSDVEDRFVNRAERLIIRVAERRVDAGRYEDALAITEPMTSVPGIPAALWGLQAVAQYELRRFEDAHASVGQALTLDPEQPEATRISRLLAER